MNYDKISADFITAMPGLCVVTQKNAFLVPVELAVKWVFKLLSHVYKGNFFPGFKYSRARLSVMVIICRR